MHAFAQKHPLGQRKLIALGATFITALCAMQKATTFYYMQ